MFLYFKIKAMFFFKYSARCQLVKSDILSSFKQFTFYKYMVAVRGGYGGEDLHTPLMDSEG